MRLRVHTIAGGRYYKAGEDVPDEDVSPTIAKYAVSEDGDAADVPELKPPRPPKGRLKAGKRIKH